MAEEKPVEPKRDARKEILMILEECMRQILAIPFGPVYDSKQETPDAHIRMHWCGECRGYHRVKEPQG